MRDFIARLNLARRTIARDLTFRLVITITLVFGFAGTVNYFYSVDRDTTALYEKANEIMDNLASVLVTPLWNLNVEELKKVVEVYRQSGIVLDIKVIDDQSATLVPMAKEGPVTERAFLEMTRVIHHDKTPIGKVTVFFSDADIIAKQREIAVYSIVVFAFLTIALIVATTLLLKRYVNEPFQKLESGLEVISAGAYAHQFATVPQEDMNDITRKVMWMATEIAKREQALEENRSKLEILNQAILDIFSCSDTESLVRAVLGLTHKVCGVDRGWFLGSSGQASADQDQSATPLPLICVRGHVFEATDAEVRPHIGKGEADRAFTFEIKSRYRTVGEVTLSFDQVPDPSVTSLLKSLMSLTTVAMIRQSFIRETAFIAAELQVAEAVQRSMLPDEAKAPANAVVSYHYEPVLRVGGDWFSVIESRDGESLYVILGDVTGHGLAQGLVTTAMAGAIQVVEGMLAGESGAANGISKPSQIVTQLGNVIARIAGKSNLRMTCVAAQLDFKNQKLHICNAGHTFPLILRHGDGAHAKVEAAARNQQLMLGETSLSGARHHYTDTPYELSPEDVLIFYTDGLTEAVDKDGKPFTRKFQRHFFKQAQRKSVGQIKDDLIQLFRQHTGDVPCKDDICVLVVGRKYERTLRIAS